MNWGRDWVSISQTLLQGSKGGVQAAGAQVGVPVLLFFIETLQ